MFDAIRSGSPGAKLRGKAGGLGAARPPNERDGRGGGTVNGFWRMVPSRGMVKVGLILWAGYGLNFEKRYAVTLQINNLSTPKLCCMLLRIGCINSFTLAGSLVLDQNVHKSTSRSNFGTFSISFWIVLSRWFRW